MRDRTQLTDEPTELERRAAGTRPNSTPSRTNWNMILFCDSGCGKSLFAPALINLTANLTAQEIERLATVLERAADEPQEPNP